MLTLASLLFAGASCSNLVLANLWVLAGASEAPELTLEFFDYLGSLVERDGEWVDPETLDERFIEVASPTEEVVSPTEELASSTEVASSSGESEETINNNVDAQTKVSEVEQ